MPNALEKSKNSRISASTVSQVPDSQSKKVAYAIKRVNTYPSQQKSFCSLRYSINLANVF